MTIRDIWLNSNMGYDTNVKIYGFWDFTHEKVLFDGRAEELTEKAMDCEIWMLTVIDADDSGIIEIHFTLERGLTV